jgi:tRNA-(ms[2]io[6]A)-hydroxylase
MQGDWRDLAKRNKLSKAMVPVQNAKYGQDLIDKMILLIKE